MRQALNGLAMIAPEWLQSWVPPDWYHRYGRRFEQYRLPKTETERQGLAVVIGQDGYALLTQAYAPDTLPEIRQLAEVEVLRQVWVQNYYLEEEHCCFREAGNLPPGALLIQSPYDPQVRYSRKRELEWKGYKVHLTESCDENQPHFITNVITEAASKPDNATTDQVHADLAAKGLLPKEHYLDSGYIDAALLVDSQTQHGVDLIGPALADTSWQAQADQGFDVASFGIDWQAQQVTCPNGHHSRVWSESHDTYANPVIHVQFVASDCRDCDLRSRCTHSVEGPRTLKLRPQAQHVALQQARKRQATPEFIVQYARRAGIEGTLSQAVRAYDLRRSRYFGQKKTHLQHIFSSIAINLARFVSWFNQLPLAVTRISAFASLAPG
jgi:transposase